MLRLSLWLLALIPTLTFAQCYDVQTLTAIASGEKHVMQLDTNTKRVQLLPRTRLSHGTSEAILSYQGRLEVWQHVADNQPILPALHWYRTTSHGHILNYFPTPGCEESVIQSIKDAANQSIILDETKLPEDYGGAYNSDPIVLGQFARYTIGQYYFEVYEKPGGARIMVMSKPHYDSYLTRIVWNSEQNDKCVELSELMDLYRGISPKELHSSWNRKDSLAEGQWRYSTGMGQDYLTGPFELWDFVRDEERSRLQILTDDERGKFLRYYPGTDCYGWVTASVKAAAVDSIDIEAYVFMAEEENSFIGIESGDFHKVYFVEDLAIEVRNYSYGVEFVVYRPEVWDAPNGIIPSEVLEYDIDLMYTSRESDEIEPIYPEWSTYPLFPGCSETSDMEDRFDCYFREFRRLLTHHLVFVSKAEVRQGGPMPEKPVTIIRYIIEPSGVVSTVEVAESCGSTILDHNAVRMIRLHPRVKPVRQGRENIAVAFYIRVPVTMADGNRSVRF